MPSKQVEDVYNARRAAGEIDARGRELPQTQPAATLRAQADEIERLRGGIASAIDMIEGQRCEIAKDILQNSLKEASA